MKAYRVYYRIYHGANDKAPSQIVWKTVNAVDSQQAKLEAEVWISLITKVELIEDEQNRKS